MKSLDMSIYVITTNVPQLGRTHEDVAAAALMAGANVVQFRDKTMADQEFIEVARRIQNLAHAHGAALIINDRVDVAIAIRADGIHVGRQDRSISDIKRIVPPEMIIGVSATNYAEAVELRDSGADYLGVGPIFPTTSKDDATPAIGLQELARICHDVEIPVVAIGGITQANLGEIIASGAAGAAVIAAIASAPDMQAATTALRAKWEAHRCR